MCGRTRKEELEKGRGHHKIQDRRRLPDRHPPFTRFKSLRGLTPRKRGIKTRVRELVSAVSIAFLHGHAHNVGGMWRGRPRARDITIICVRADRLTHGGRGYKRGINRVGHAPRRLLEARGDGMLRAPLPPLYHVST